MVEFEYSDLFLQSSIEKQMKIISDDGVIIDNSCLHLESFSLNESLCSESTLKFGCCEASFIQFRTSNVYTPLKDKWLTVTETLNGNSEATIQLGKYKVFSDTPDSDKSYCDVVAYDVMYDILNTDVSSWYNSLLFPMTLKSFRNSFFNHLGITQVETSLINDNITLNKTVSVGENEVLSGKDIITSICEINGVFGHINRLGQFTYINLKEIQYALFPSNTLYPANNLYPKDWSKTLHQVGSKYQTCNYEDYTYEKITKLSLIVNDSTINVSEGIEGKEYVINNNLLISDKSEQTLHEIAQRLLNVINIVEYRPYTCTTIYGTPCVEVGDPIRINTPRQNIMSYVLNRTLKGIQSLSDSFSASGNNESVVSVNSIQSTFNAIQGKFHKVNNTLEEFSSEIYDPTTGSSKITQTANAITSEVKARTTADSALSSRIQQTASSIELNVNNGEDNATVSLTITKEDGSVITTQAKTIKFNGDVIFASDLTDGTTEISGDNIKTGKIKADYIKTDELVVGKNIAMGENATISWSKVTNQPTISSETEIKGWATTITEDTIKTANLEAKNLTVYNGNFTNSFSVNVNKFQMKTTSSLATVGRISDDGSHYEYIEFSDSGTTLKSHDGLTIQSRTNIYITPSGGTMYVYGDLNCSEMTFKDLNGNKNPPISTSSTRSRQVSSLTCTSGGDGIAIYGTWGGSSFSSRTLVLKSSDKRLKENIEECEIENALDIVNQIKMHSFDWKDGIRGHQKIGFIADELEEIDSKFSIGGNIDDEGIINYKSVDSFYLLGYLTKAIQELSDENKKLKLDLISLQNEVNMIKSRIEEG